MYKHTVSKYKMNHGNYVVFCLYIQAKMWLISCAACPQQIIFSSVLDSGQVYSSTAATSRQTTIDFIVDLVSVLSSSFGKEAALAFSCCLTQTVCAYLTPCPAVRAKLKIWSESTLLSFFLTFCQVFARWLSCSLLFLWLLSEKNNLSSLFLSIGSVTWISPSSWISKDSCVKQP